MAQRRKDINLHGSWGDESIGFDQWLKHWTLVLATMQKDERESAQIIIGTATASYMAQVSEAELQAIKGKVLSDAIEAKVNNGEGMTLDELKDLLKRRAEV